MSTTITSTALGHTLVAQTAFVQGATILSLDGIESMYKNRYSIQLDTDLHLNPYPHDDFDEQMKRCPWIVTNHSCDPNVKIVGRDFIAIRDIQENEPITFDYETTEWEMDEPFTCGCGTESCRRRIQGYKFLNDANRERLRAITSEYLLVR